MTERARTTHVLLAVQHSADDRVSPSDVGEQVLDCMLAQIRVMTRELVDEDVRIELLDARDDTQPLGDAEFAVDISNVDRVASHGPLLLPRVDLPARCGRDEFCITIVSATADDARLAAIAREIAARLTAQPVTATLEATDERCPNCGVSAENAATLARQQREHAARVKP